MDITELREFLVYCGREGYAAIHDTDEKKEADSSTSIILSRHAWTFHDNYFGGEPFGGREVVLYEGKPVWLMAYYGRATDEAADLSALYRFLKKALAQVPPEAPFRGPRELNEENWSYQNIWQGTISDFAGEETIAVEGNPIYKARYVGGLVDVQN